MSDVSAILRRGNRHETMLITVDIKAFHVEAAPAASSLSCWYGFDVPRRLDNVNALAGRCAR